MERRELAERAYSALERDDLEGFLALMHPEVEFNSLIAEADTARFHGHEGVREWWRMLRGSLGGVRLEIVHFELLDDDVGLIKVRASGTVSGVEVEQTMWQTTLVRDELAARWWSCRTEEEAREAAAARWGD